SHHAGGDEARQCPGRVAPLTLVRVRGYNRTPPMIQHTLRASRVLVGVVLVLVGIVLALPLVPGPGLLFVFAGLTVLGGEFEWARRLSDRMRRTFHRATG